MTNRTKLQEIEVCTSLAMFIISLVTLFSRLRLLLQWSFFSNLSKLSELDWVKFMFVTTNVFWRWLLFLLSYLVKKRYRSFHSTIHTICNYIQVSISSRSATRWTRFMYNWWININVTAVNISCFESSLCSQNDRQQEVLLTALLRYV